MPETNPLQRDKGGKRANFDAVDDDSCILLDLDDDGGYTIQDKDQDEEGETKGEIKGDGGEGGKEAFPQADVSKDGLEEKGEPHKITRDLVIFCGTVSRSSGSPKTYADS